MSQGFEGMDELIRDLEKFSSGVVEQAAVPALRVGGRAAVALARASSPKRTGRFARSIHVGGDTGGDSDWNPGGDRNWYEDLGAEEGSATTAAVAVGSTLWYGRWVEFGGPHNAAAYPVGNAVEAVDPVVRGALEEKLDEWAGQCGF